ncbi:putative transmembrane protein, partial [Thalictrum thalictroides]
SFKDTLSNIHSHSPNDLQEEEHNNQNKFRPSSSSGNHGYSQRARSSSPPSPILSLPREHSLAFLTNGENHNNHQNQAEPSSYFVSQLFQPFREDVNKALNRVIPTNLTRFASAYFDHSERTSHLLCILLESINQARSLYTPLHNLLDVLSLDSPLSQPQGDEASNVFLQFNIHENPFPLRISQNFQEILLCLSALNQQLRSRLIWNSSSSLYDLTVRGSSVLNDDVNIIDRLVTQLQAVVESDKLMVRTGLERGKDRYPLQEMVEQ